VSETTFDDTLQAFESAYAEFIAIAENYPENLQTQAGACGTWSAWEIVAHINGWFVEGQRRYRRFSKGTGQITYNDDAFNEVSLWIRADKDYEQLIAELKQLVADFAQMARDVSDHHRARDNRYALWLQLMAKEARVHGVQLQVFQEATA